MVRQQTLAASLLLAALSPCDAQLLAYGFGRPAACAPLAEYAAAAREMRRRYGVTRVFVATDDGGAAAALAAALGPDGMEARAPPSRLWGARRGRSAAAGLAGGSGAETLGPNAAERALGISFERFGGL